MKKWKWETVPTVRVREENPPVELCSGRPVLLLLLFNIQVFAPAALHFTLLTETDLCYQAPSRCILVTSTMKVKAADVSPNQEHSSLSVHLVPFVTLLAPVAPGSPRCPGNMESRHTRPWSVRCLYSWIHRRWFSLLEVKKPVWLWQDLLLTPGHLTGGDLCLLCATILLEMLDDFCLYFAWTAECLFSYFLLLIVIFVLFHYSFCILIFPKTCMPLLFNFQAAGNENFS